MVLVVLTCFLQHCAASCKENLPGVTEPIASFSNDDSDGDGSENVTIKMNSRFLKHSCDNSNSL